MPLAPAEISSLGANLRDPVGYRKSGLSLNHIVGCPLDCAYCIRHRDGNYEMKAPHMLMTDEDAVVHLQKHKYFQRDITPLQILNKATDGFLPAVEPHLMRTLELLDAAGLRNHTLIITRYRISEDACRRLNALEHLKVTLLVTYSGITDHRIEPIANQIPIASLKLAYAAARQYRVVLYWRPIVPGRNDSSEEIATACSLGEHAHAVVFTGLSITGRLSSILRIADSHNSIASQPGARYCRSPWRPAS